MRCRHASSHAGFRADVALRWRTGGSATSSRPAALEALGSPANGGELASGEGTGRKRRTRGV